MVHGFSEEGFRQVREATRRVLGRPTTGAQRRRQAPVLGGRAIPVERRTYYPGQVGLHKLYAADGDLIWDALPSAGNYTISLRKSGDVTIAPGWYSQQYHFWTESGDTITEHHITDTAFLNVRDNTVCNSSLLGDDCYFAWTPLSAPSNQIYVDRFSVSSKLHLSRAVSPNGVVSAVDGGYYHCVEPNNLQLRRRSATDGAIVMSTSDPVYLAGGSRDIEGEIVSDGTHYYIASNVNFLTPPNTGKRVYKIRISDFAEVGAASFLPTSARHAVCIRDGLVGCITSSGSESIWLIDSSDMSIVFDTGDLHYRNTSMDVCDDFALSIGPTSSEVAALSIHRLSLAGAVEWTQEIDTFPSSFSTPFNIASRYGRARISQDKSKVYVTGSLAVDGHPAALITLDSDTGEVLWWFYGEMGVSLIDEGSVLYLGTQTRMCPRYR